MPVSNARVCLARVAAAAEATRRQEAPPDRDPFRRDCVPNAQAVARAAARRGHPYRVIRGIARDPGGETPAVPTDRDARLDYIMTHGVGHWWTEIQPPGYSGDVGVVVEPWTLAAEAGGEGRYIGPRPLNYYPATTEADGRGRR